MLKKSVLKIGLLLSALLCLKVAFAEDLSQIPQPLPGESVCTAYVSEYSHFGSHLENPLRSVRNLPQRYCRRGRALDGSFFSIFGRRLRVAAIGDFYSYAPETGSEGVQSEVVDPSRSRIVCHARLVSESGEVTSIRNLDEGLCVSGLQFEVVIKGHRQRVTVEAANDFHYIPASETVFTAPTSEQLPNRYRSPRIQPASLGIAI